jgi:predicted RNA-binding Zn-ribbon protein involved in translation (DUF1610 family)
MTQAPTSAERRSFPCRQCGAAVEFAPGTTHLKCPFCAAENAIEAAGEVSEQDYAAVLASLEAAAPHREERTVKCDACAAEVTVPANVTSFACCFCGSAIVSQVVCVSRLTPTGVLPFGIDKEKASGAFRRWISSRWFAPSALKRRSLLDEGLSGVYLPSWTYDCRAETAYQGMRGDAYYVTVGSGKNRRTERRIRWSPRSGRVLNTFDDVLVVASRTLPEKMVRELEPWDLKAVKPYADEWLAGLRAETYTVDIREGWVLAQGIMGPMIDSTIRRDIGGDEQRILSKRTAYSGVTFKHLLLPVWVSAYRYEGKVYRFVVNARTGEVQGERPWSAWKIAGLVVAIVIAVGVAVLIARSA